MPKTSLKKNKTKLGFFKSNKKTSKKLNKNNSNYVVVIPSYNRVDTITKKTLNTLKVNKISPSRIYIFVANKEEEKIYRESVPRNLYNKIVVGVLGLKNQRNFIRDYFKEGQQIVQMDDDVSKIYELYFDNKLEGKKAQKARNIKNLDKFFKDAFRLLKKEKFKLFGVYPVNNPFFMSDKVTKDLRFIVGPMWGIINSHDKKRYLDFDEKEDVLRTLLHYTLDGGVIRYNNITFETAYYKEKGGMQSEKKDRKKESLKSAKVLVKRFPTLCTLYLKKKIRLCGG